MKTDLRLSLPTPHDPLPTQRGPKVLRRVLLGATTALLTARMIAPGEDPGLLQHTSAATNLLMVLLWLLAAVALAAWRLWSRPAAWRGGLVELALLVAVVLAFVSAETAGYRHPARLIAWDWLVLFVAVCLIRQLAVSVADQQAVLGVFLAGAAALSFQAVYQALLGAPASATFARPEPFAAWLALFLPALIAAVIVCRPGRAPLWQAIFTAVFALLGAVAFAAAVLSAFHAADATSPPLLDTWRATLNLIRDRSWLGVGEGNFSRAFPRYQGPNSGAAVMDPSNFLLEIAATTGVLTLLAVLVALGAFFVRAGRALSREETDPVDAPPASEPDERIAWEYYIGGMCGLVLGLVLRMTNGEHTLADIVNEGGIACARCLVWLTTFVLFERVRWPGRVRVAALAAGVAAALLVLSVGPGGGLPSVTVPLWAAVALALNALPQPANAAVNRYAVARILPVPVAGVLALLFFLNVFNPVTSGADHVRVAIQNGKAYRRRAEGKDPRFFDKYDDRESRFLQESVIGKLADAAAADPDDARSRVLMARWYGELWVINATKAGLAKDAMDRALDAQKMDPHGWDGYDAEYQLRMEIGRRLEAVGQLPGLAIGPAYRVFLREARWPNPIGREAVEQAKTKYRDAVAAKARPDEVNPYEPAIQYMEAADVLLKYLPNDPNDAELRFRLADALFKAWEDDRCREQAQKALDLDAAAGRTLLTDDQRRKLNVWRDLSSATTLRR